MRIRLQSDAALLAASQTHSYTAPQPFHASSKPGITVQLNVLKAKIHRASTTHAELHYEGSCAIDGDLLDASGIHEYEQIHIYNVNNGQRFITYAIRAEEGSGIISVNGAAAHRAAVGDLLIICAYALIDQNQIADHTPTLVYVDAGNRITHSKNAIAKQMK